MPLPTFKTRDEVPEAVRDGYIERDGEWVPDVEDVSGLKNKNAELLRKEREATQRARELEQQLKDKAKGLTDEEIAAQRKREEELTRPHLEENAALKAELRKLKLDGNVQKMLLEAGADAKRMDRLYKLVGERFDLSDSGTPVLKDKPTEKLPDYIANVLAPEFSEYFLAKGKSGDQFPGGAGDGGATKEAAVKMVTENPKALLQLANSK